LLIWRLNRQENEQILNFFSLNDGRKSFFFLYLVSLGLPVSFLFLLDSQWY
jgi:hypothetical protein